jgi:PAS domain S-box-containing protein
LNGVAVASNNKINLNTADEHYIIRSDIGEKTISRPFIDKQLNTPVFVMTVPIQDKQTKIVGSISGVINLGVPNFLDDLTKSRYGKTGYYLLVAPKYRMVITASEKSRVMEQLPAKGINPFIDSFIDGYEGPAETVTPRGVKMLASAKPVHIANWYVCVLLPLAEAYAPILAMQHRMLLATFLLTLIIGGAIWWMLKRELSPLVVTLKNLASWSHSPNDVQFLPVFGRKEIDELIGGFNRLLATLQRLNQALNQKERYLRELIDNFPFMVWLKNTEGCFLAANQVLAKNFGEDNSNNMFGKTDFDYSPKELAEGYRKDDLLVMQTKQQKMLEEKVINHLGEISWFETFKAPVFDENGKALGTVGFARDISERKQIELQLHENQMQLQLLVEKERQNSIEKSNFLAMLTHELKSPLATIELATKNIQRSQSPAITELSFKHIQTAAHDMSVITQRCLLADKLEQGNSTINLTTFSLDVLIHEIIQNESRIQLDMLQPLLITSDELSCQIIVGNLVENALKYSPANSIVNLTVTTEQTGILISILNEIGKAGKPDSDKIFEKYYRSTNAQRLRGTGLGLWLAQGIARQLDGQVNYIEHNDKVEFQLWLSQQNLTHHYASSS